MRLDCQSHRCHPLQEKALKNEEKNVCTGKTPLNREDLEFRKAAKDYARRQKHHQLQKEREDERFVRMKRKREEKAALGLHKETAVTDWLAAHVRHTGQDEDFVKRSCLYNQYKHADVDHPAVSSKQQFFRHLLAMMGKRCYREQIYRRHNNHKGVFLGWKQECGT